MRLHSCHRPEELKIANMPKIVTDNQSGFVKVIELVKVCTAIFLLVMHLQKLNGKGL